MPSLFLIYANDLDIGIKSRVCLFTDDTILYSVIRTPTDSTQLQEDLRTLVSWEGRWLISFNVEKCHQLTLTKKWNRIPTRYILHNQTHDSCEVPWSRVERKPPLEETHPINCSKSQQNEPLRTQEPEGMPNCCPDTLLQRPFASSARVNICGVGTLSATSEVNIGNGAMTVSPLHPS